ncbi:hypothetical protein [Magnetospirillum gryphiswaldense]|uniref:Uncharacterized protein n=1 Tax=Magnetospirillum gryphiswaldense TaxID=55518 RepID=A4TYD8_9PROT|nr:hypothetical protein [Magnetospirillum gryphiswaldense]AVM74735.1 hypothetical protein MSR1_22500 [Magnetospirillum gryphiswaldense MSR-1]AVM78638.1 hypothetical protein MSR1L_22500 [Magnetospirillum gryphiswaldense]CAM75645.1 conserved hypothetical protein [Magnetospirillum gryphiswaldense MSR-1]
MAYLSKDLSVLAYANGFTLWHYATPDAGTVVDTSGYFNPAADMLRAGDMIIANLETAGTQKAGLFFVRQAAAGVVDVADMTQVGAANTD